MNFRKFPVITYLALMQLRHLFLTRVVFPVYCLKEFKYTKTVLSSNVQNIFVDIVCAVEKTFGKIEKN